MLKMAVGHSEDVDPHDALTAVLEQCAGVLGEEAPRAGLLISTHEFDPTELIARVSAAYPDAEIVGSTSAAEMSSVLGFQEGSVMLTLFASDTVDITVGLGTGIIEDPVGAARRAVQEAVGKTDREPRLCITIPALCPDQLGVQEGLTDALGDGVPVLGGVSSATFADPGAACQFTSDRVVHDGVAVMLFSGALSFSFGVANGWRPVGKKGRVTRASDSVVQEIDGHPAVEFYERYLGAGTKPALANPLAVFEDGAEDFYLRAAAAHDEATGSILVVGGLPVDSTVQLSVAMTDEIFDGTKSAVDKAMAAYPQSSPPEAALIVSCMIRKALLGTRTGTEMDIVRGQLGAAMPICGFYSYGEIAPIDSGMSQLHNETIVAVLLGSS